MNGSICSKAQQHQVPERTALVCFHLQPPKSFALFEHDTLIQNLLTSFTMQHFTLGLSLCNTNLHAFFFKHIAFHRCSLMFYDSESTVAMFLFHSLERQRRQVISGNVADVPKQVAATPLEVRILQRTRLHEIKASFWAITCQALEEARDVISITRFYFHVTGHNLNLIDHAQLRVNK